MVSHVFYRWGASNSEKRVDFDGTHISVFDLKREMILQAHMGNGKDEDVKVFDNVTGEEFKDDNYQVPRSSNVIAKRLPPAAGKSRGTAQNYIMGTSAGDALTGDHRIEAHAKDAMRAKQSRGNRGAGGTYQSMSRRFDGKEDRPAPEPSVQIPVDAGIAAFQAQQDDAWQENLEELNQTAQRMPAHRRAPPRPQNTNASSGGKFDYSLPPDKEPPVGYICYRCGQKGHWIQDCTNAAQEGAMDAKRFVRVTGIPRSFLKTVETPTTGEGSSGGAMLTADGGFVRAVPDQQQFLKQIAAKPRANAGADAGDATPISADLLCPICDEILLDAVQTPCCRAVFCKECITNTLVNRAFECPSCESKVGSVDDLKPDEGIRARVAEYKAQRQKTETKDEAEEGEETQVKSEEGSVPPAGSGADGNQSIPTPAPAQVGSTLDPMRMQEMLNPQVMQTYLVQVNKMLRDTRITPESRVLLQAQLQMVNQTVLQMQMLAASGLMAQPQNIGMAMGMSNAMGNGMAMGTGVGNGIGAGVGLGMGPGMGMMGMNQASTMHMGGMGMNQNQNQSMGMGMGMNMGQGGGGMGVGMGMGGRGRGFVPRGGFNNRGRGVGVGLNGAGRGMVRPMMKRPAEEGMGGGEKQQRVV